MPVWGLPSTGLVTQADDPSFSNSVYFNKNSRTANPPDPTLPSSIADEYSEPLSENQRNQEISVTSDSDYMRVRISFVQCIALVAMLVRRKVECMKK